jgi:hypothetical protein
MNRRLPQRLREAAFIRRPRPHLGRRGESGRRRPASRPYGVWLSTATEERTNRRASPSIPYARATAIPGRQPHAREPRDSAAAFVPCAVSRAWPKAETAELLADAGALACRLRDRAGVRYPALRPLDLSGRGRSLRVARPWLRLDRLESSLASCRSARAALWSRLAMPLLHRVRLAPIDEAARSRGPGLTVPAKVPINRSFRRGPVAGKDRETGRSGVLPT